MPYGKRKIGNKWEVYKKLPGGKVGRIFGTHDTEEEANEQLAALYANEKKENSDFSIKSIVLYDNENK